jgi:hypothetical protein
MKPIYQSWSEHKHQVQFFCEARKILRPLGLRDLLYAVPNGGKRDKKTGGDLKAEGVVKGVPDINFDYPHSGYHGLRIEMKKYGEKARPEQLKIIAAMRKAGYHVVVCEGWEESLCVLRSYLK